VIFGPDPRALEIRKALAPLLDFRRDQAGEYFKSFEYQRGQRKADFLALHKAGHGAADPRRVPYYLLLVGDPQSIPYRFQYELDVQYGVGRIHFETIEEYANYARNVVAVEATARRRAPVTFFAVRNDDDEPTRRTAQELVEPLTRFQDKAPEPWPVRSLSGPGATKERLRQLLGGSELPSLLFTASHGMAFPLDDPRQLEHQGALLCQDWPGPVQWKGRPVPPEQYFSAQDVPPDADFRGLITFHFACYSAGTPESDDFADPVFERPQRIAPHPFTSRLAQRLLGHPRGALAVLGHVDRAWTTSFSVLSSEGTTDAQEAPIGTFESMFQRLMNGYPIGSATEYLNQRHAEIAVELGNLWADRENLQGTDQILFSRMWRANNDARNFIVLGDPAVRLTEAKAE
jgi:hypothetical protein